MTGKSEITRLQRFWTIICSYSPQLLTVLFVTSFWLHIQNASAYYGLNANYMTNVAKCESQLDPNVTSKNGLYHGGYQYSWGTWNWMSRQAGYAGWSPYDAEAAAYTTAWAFSHGYASHWPRCRYARA